MSVGDGILRSAAFLASLARRIAPQWFVRVEAYMCNDHGACRHSGSRGGISPIARRNDAIVEALRKLYQPAPLLRELGLTPP